MQTTTPSSLLVLYTIFLFCSNYGLQAQCPPAPSVQEACSSWEIAVLESVIQQMESCEGYKDSLGLAYHRLGVFYFYEKEMGQAERMEKAFEATRKSIAVRSELSPVPYELIGQSYLNMTLFYKDLLAYSEAAETAAAASAAFDQAGSPKLVNSLWEESEAMELIGEYAKALNYLQLASEKAAHFKDTSRLGVCYNLMGRTYNEQGRYVEALKPLDKAYSLFSSFPASQQDDYQLASCLLNRGNAYDGLGRYQDALEAYRASRGHALSYGDEDFALRIKNNMGIPLKKMGQLAASEKVLREVLAEATEKGYSRDIAAANDNLGDLYMLRKQYPMALKLYQRAIEHSAPGFQPQNIEDNPRKQSLREAADKKRLLNFLNNKGRAWKAYYTLEPQSRYLENALECYRLADELIGLMRQEHSEQSSKLFWRNTTRPVYEQAIEACFLLEDAQTAFFFMEKSRAILLLEALLAGNARQVIPDSIAKQELQLKRQLLAAREATEGGSGDAAHLLATQEALESFLEELAIAYPAYHDIRYNLKVTNPEEVQRQLIDEHTQVLEFFLTDDFIYLLHFGASEVPQLLRMERGAAFSTRLQQVMSYLSGAGDVGPEAYQEMAFPLFEQLLAPVYNEYYKNLLLIPDGELSFLPFDALPRKKGPATSFGQLDFLVQQHNIYYAYSATVLANLIQHEAATGALMQMAPGFKDGQRGLAPLLNIDRGMARLDGYQLYSGQEASKEHFLKQASQARLIHLTTHASTSTEEGFPQIEFIGQSLALPELYAMELSAQLVVLDACQTNLGRIEAGEGAMSLARGFAFAGANSLISSLWEVRDAYTALLFKSFYEQLLAGKSKAKALHLAKRAYLENALTSAEKSPRHWAGFVYIGKDGPMELQQVSRLWASFKSYGWLGAWLLLLLFLTIFKLSKKG